MIGTGLIILIECRLWARKRSLVNGSFQGYVDEQKLELPSHSLLLRLNFLFVLKIATKRSLN
jgi:hypothetical protein